MPIFSFFGLLRRFFYVQAEENHPDGVSASKGKVLVGGGTGFVGGELCRLLKRNHYDVVIVSRTKTKCDDHVITWDELSKSGIPRGTRAVVNVAGQNVLDPLNSWTPKFQQLVYQSRIRTTEALRDAVVRCEPGHRPKAFVQVTGVGYYPPSQQTVYDEDSPGGEHDYLARLVVDWENAGKIPKEIAESDGIRNVWIRSGVVLGRRGGLIGNIFWQFFFGLGGRMGSGQQPMAWIHVKDLAEMIKFSIEEDSVAGVLNGVAPQLITNKEFVEEFAKTMNRPCFLPTPAFIWSFLFGPERATMVIEGQKVVPRRALDFGYKFRFPTIDRACFEFAHAFYKDSDDN